MQGRRARRDYNNFSSHALRRCEKDSYRKIMKNQIIRSRVNLWMV